MKITLGIEILQQINAQAEGAYPNEGAGFLFGLNHTAEVSVSAILPIANAMETNAQHNRYLISEQEYVQAEEEAAQRGLDLIGVFHSHPDHPAFPSEFDRARALPNFSYIITSVRKGQAGESRSWRLREDRSAFEEELLQIQRDRLPL